MAIKWNVIMRVLTLFQFNRSVFFSRNVIKRNTLKQKSNTSVYAELKVNTRLEFYDHN